MDIAYHFRIFGYGGQTDLFCRLTELEQTVRLLSDSGQLYLFRRILDRGDQLRVFSQFSELGTSYKKICYSHICMPVMPVAQRLVIIILFELMRKFFR